MIARSQSFVLTKIVSFHYCPSSEKCAVAEPMMLTGLCQIELMSWGLGLMRNFSSLSTDCFTTVMSLPETPQ